MGRRRCCWLTRQFVIQVRSKEQTMASLQDLEFGYAPVRDQVRDLREYL
jgi:hypothetical protein